jgi:hypothetical protein
MQTIKDLHVDQQPNDMNIENKLEYNINVENCDYNDNQPEDMQIEHNQISKKRSFKTLGEVAKLNNYDSDSSTSSNDDGDKLNEHTSFNQYLTKATYLLSLKKTCLTNNVMH